MSRKKVLIVDDSRVMRAWLKQVLEEDIRLEIVGEASTAVEARDFLRNGHADVLTLDIEMPGMSGLEFLNRLMRARPMPVVMLSSLTSAGSDAAIQALSSGAIDCILKPVNGHDQRLTRDICERVYHAARIRTVQRRGPSEQPVENPVVARPQSTRRSEATYRRGSIILIGASTGGVSALEALLPTLDPSGPPVVIVQHMPGNFLKSFSERLQRQLHQNVRLADEHSPLERGDVVLAPGVGKHTELVRRGDSWFCRLTDDVENSLHCPSVNNLFNSAVSDARYVTAVILTGLGQDGAQGMLRLFEAGAATYGQNEDTCVVYGMPKAAFTMGAVQKQLPIDRLGAAIRAGSELTSGGGSALSRAGHA